LFFIPPVTVANLGGETRYVVLLLSDVSAANSAEVSLVGVLGLDPLDPVDEVAFSLRVVPDVVGVGEFRLLISIDILLYTGSFFFFFFNKNFVNLVSTITRSV
jgi:hypothetical protein